MKILFIADNRNRKNLGCRATSIALSSLVSQRHDIVGCITGALTLLRPTAEDFLSWDFEKTISNIKSYAAVDKRYQQLDLDRYDFDGIVINGEGTMIMSSPPRIDTMYYLLFAYWAKKKKKNVFFVNAMYSDCPVSERNKTTLQFTNDILSQCDFVSARDPLSYRYAVENLKSVKLEYVPDALFTWLSKANLEDLFWRKRELMPFGMESDADLREGCLKSRRYILISGGSLAARNKPGAIESYCALVDSLKRVADLDIVLLEACDGDSFLYDVAKKTDTMLISANLPIFILFNILSHATVFVSGRFHPSIMASIGRVPCIFFEPNSHKNLGLQEMLGYHPVRQFHACPTQEDVSDICNIVSRILYGRVLVRIDIQSLSRKAAELLKFM